MVTLPPPCSVTSVSRPVRIVKPPALTRPSASTVVAPLVEMASVASGRRGVLAASSSVPWCVRPVSRPPAS